MVKMSKDGQNTHASIILRVTFFYEINFLYTCEAACSMAVMG